MMKLRALALSLALLLSLAGAFSQTVVDKNVGTYRETRHGIMDGNLVETVYYNFGEIADWKNWPTISGVWPKGTNHTYVDGVAVIVQAEAQSATGPIHPLETNYYEYTRYDPSSGVTYGWQPLPGYANQFQATPAQSSDPTTWPPHWPDRPSSWDGYWDGFFGKGVLNADLESYFVFDDNSDRQYIQAPYYFHPDAADSTRGGLGMQVHGRGFQWSQVLAEDVIFWYYEITNMGTTDYAKTCFAQYVDWGIGGHDNSSNNAGSYNKSLNISYAWSTVSYGSPGHWSPVGYTGYAFLESPGISDDNIDNDQDGLTDERRDNNASVFITDPFKDPFLRDVQSDTAKFRQFYGYSWKPHWDADENCNWRTFTDLNHNGKWDPGEPLNDDVGSDGLGPLDPGYPGPDPDGTEGNGKPDQGEPNFGILDKDESDQLGLTGFLIAAVHTYDLNNDERNWTAFTSLPAPPDQQPNLTNVNLGNWFSSFLFHMYGRNTYSQTTGQAQLTGQTERFSMALIYGNNTDDLFRRKRTVQQIYNASYQFAKPPAKPIVKAVAGDHRVTLYWDNLAEQTFDAFYQKYNFEGYRVYRSTESNFLSAQIITDAYGNPTFRQPIAQYDLVDSVMGLFPLSVNGALFYLGDDSGLQHSYIDTTVQNGQTYYYAVCSYDQGFLTTTVTGQQVGIPPSECTSIIKVDVNGNVKTDVNTAVIVPRAASAGYIPGKITTAASGPGTGSVAVPIIDPDSILNNHNYILSFVDSTVFHTNPNPWYTLVDVGAGDTLLNMVRMKTAQDVTTVMAGFAVQINNAQTVGVNTDATRWKIGKSNLVTQVGFDSRYAPALQARRVNLPEDFDVTFTPPGQGDVSFPSSSFATQGTQSNIVIRNTTEGTNHVPFLFYDNNANGLFDAGDAIFIICGDSVNLPPADFPTANKSWSLSLIQDTTIAASKQVAPQPGDVFHIAITKPFRTGETVKFQTQSPSLDAAKARTDMSRILVVPNPYVGAASWEPQPTGVGRGDRLIYFIHLPHQCTIRIYTISGHLVQTLQHQSGIDDGQEPWNLVSRDGMNIAFGVYVYHVDAPGVGTYVSKFAVVK
ncbi:MAG TPA: hypothetical protein VL221_13575 [Bacteroidota bacterium]|nr:hypothetical protein [Bacteroidota bacterium]